MNGEDLIKKIADELNAKGVPPTESKIIARLRTYTMNELKGLFRENVQP